MLVSHPNYYFGLIFNYCFHPLLTKVNLIFAIASFIFFLS